ncbi:hypothetical protein Aduo_002559 [Ancylostoma duodenale]
MIHSLPARKVVDIVFVSDHHMFYEEDFEKKKDDLMKMSLDETFVFLLSILTQVLPRRDDVIVPLVDHASLHCANEKKPKSPQLHSVAKGFITGNGGERSAVQVEQDRAIFVAGLPEPDPGLRGAVDVNI